jgi:hypothetical protein
MLYTTLKVLLTALLVIAVNEAAKRSSALGAIIASLPLSSLLAFVWLYAETGDTEKISSLSTSIFWYVLPSLVLFIALPLFLARGMSFWPSLLAAGTLTFAAYVLMTSILARLGITL